MNRPNLEDLCLLNFFVKEIGSIDLDLDLDSHKCTRYQWIRTPETVALFLLYWETIHAKVVSMTEKMQPKMLAELENIEMEWKSMCNEEKQGRQLGGDNSKRRNRMTRYPWAIEKDPFILTVFPLEGPMKLSVEQRDTVFELVNKRWRSSHHATQLLSAISKYLSNSGPITRAIIFGLGDIIQPDMSYNGHLPPRVIRVEWRDRVLVRFLQLVRMLTSGRVISSILEILGVAPRCRRRLLFSATLTNDSRHYFSESSSIYLLGLTFRKMRSRSLPKIQFLAKKMRDSLKPKALRS